MHEVMTVFLGGEMESVWAEDDKPTQFATQAEALAELEELDGISRRNWLH